MSFKVNADNPYQPSQAIDLSDVEVPMRTGPQIMAAAREIFVKWEWRRLSYNIILASCVIGFGIRPRNLVPTLSIPNFWIDCIFGAVICNICFLAGPLVELYLTWLREKRHDIVCRLLFILGLLLSVGVAVIAVRMSITSWHLLPPQN